MGTLTLNVAIADQGTHLVNIFAKESPSRPGGTEWNSTTPNWSSSNVSRVTKQVAVLEGSQFVFTGNWDPPVNSVSDWQYWTYPFCEVVDTATSEFQVNVAAWATWNDGTGDQPAASVVAIWNDTHDGCNLQFTAATSSFISSSDQDGDGYTVAQGDCNDLNSMVHPGAVETSDDTIDVDCDGSINPDRGVIRLSLNTSGYTPVVHDASHWPTTIQLTWNAAGYYESAQIDLDKLPTEFWAEWGSPTSYDSSYWGSACHESVSVQVYHVNTGTLFPVALLKVPSQSTCHRYVTL